MRSLLPGSRPCSPPPSPIAPVLPGWVALGLCLTAWLGAGLQLRAADFNLRRPGFNAAGRFQVEVDSAPGTYSILYRGSSLTQLTEPAVMDASAGPQLTLVDPAEPAAGESRFYLVLRQPADFPGDADGDGINDWLELQYPAVLHPLRSEDATQDPDQDGRNNRDEARAGTNPTVADFAPTRVESYPGDGESGVSVNREVIWRFSETLAANTRLGTNVLYAELGSRRLLTRSQLSADRRKATLFFLEPVPASSRIRVRLDGTQVQDIHGGLVDADGDGIPGGWAEIHYDTMNSAAIPGTAVSGYVFDAEPEPGPNGPRNKPLVGVTITVDGSEQSLRATTDASGFFLLNPCPVGRFFVHIDGRTAVGSSWPTGAYYPVVGKTFEATVGSTNTSPAGAPDIYLPRIPAGSLQLVSPVSPTSISLPASVLAARPELAGLRITVPPNNLFADDGTRGGRVGLAPVPADRLPSPLPPGIRPSLVVTVQSDGGLNFDAPVPVQFPNLPDPVTGRRLAPGEKTVLISFNHDSGEWEPQGTMTISADGNFAVTDPGVGILQPGWHAAGAVGQPIPPSSGCGLAQGLQIAKEYIEWQLKQLECMGRAVLLLGSLPGGGAAVRGLGAAAQASANLNGIVSGLQSMASGLQSGQTASTLGGAFSVITGLKNSLSAALSAAFKPALLTQAQDLGVCLLEMFKEQLDFICPATACVLGPNAPNLANQQAACNGMRAALSTALNAISGYQFATGNATARLFIALDKLGTLLQSLGPNSNHPPRRDARPAQTPEEIRAEMQQTVKEALAAARELGIELEPSLRLRSALEDLTEAHAGYLAAVDGPMLLRLSAHADSYFALESGGVTTRGRSTSLGGFELPFINLNNSYRFAVYDPRRNAVSEALAPAPGFGARPIIIPDPVLRVPGINDLSGDQDGDGLTDLAEGVIGTRVDRADSDGDGASDLAEVRQGRNPLDGLSYPLGPVAGLALPDVAKGISLAGTTGYLAIGNSGLAAVDLANPLQPVLLGTLRLPGDCYGITASPTARTVAVLAFATSEQIATSESAQVHLVDVADPALPRLIRTQVFPARMIREHNGLYYVAFNDDVRIFDASTFQEVGWFKTDSLVTGLLVTESEIFVTSWNQLAIYRRQLLQAPRIGRVNGSFEAAEIYAPVSMVQDGNRLWVGSSTGLRAIDLSDRANPRLLNQPGPVPRSVRNLVLNGARQGLALTTVGPAFNAGGQTTLYDLSDPAANNRLTLIINGRGRTFDAAPLGDWWILADAQAGLTVMNVVPAGSDTVAPSVAWNPATLDEDPGREGVQVTEGRQVVFLPEVADNSSLDSTELLINGAVAGTARTVPARIAATLPLRSSGSSVIQVAFRGRDRAGNETETTGVDLELIPDVSGPSVEFPRPGTIGAVYPGAPLVLRFSEPLGGTNPPPNTLTLVHLGADGAPGGGDDTPAALLPPQWVGTTVLLWPATPLAPGRHQLVVPRTAWRDAAGNPLTSDILLTVLAVDAPFGTAIWVSPIAGRYHDPANWLAQRVPGGEDVILSVPGGTPTITLDAATVVRSLVADGPLVFNRFGSLGLRGPGQIAGPVTLNGGGLSTVSNLRVDQALTVIGGSVIVSGQLETRGLVRLEGGASLSLDGPAARWVRPGGWVLIDSGLTADNGAVAEFPELTSHQSNGDSGGLFASGSTFRADGFGSRLRLPNLASITGPTRAPFTGAPSLEIAAMRGGTVELPLLTSLSNRVRLVAADPGSRMDVPQLARVVGPESFPALISAQNQGELMAPLLALTSRCDVELWNDGLLRCAEAGVDAGLSLRGTGRIQGNVVCRGTLSPNQEGGVLRITGTLSLPAGSVFSPLVGSPFGTGSVEVAGAVQLGGTLRPVAARGATFNPGDTFEVGVFSGGLSGGFSAVDASGIRTGAVVESQLNAGRLTVRIATP